MFSDQKIIYEDKEYRVIAAEQEYIIHPAALNILPFAKTAISCSFSASYHLDGFKLYIDKLKLNNNDDSGKEYLLKSCRLYYSGAILIASNMVGDYCIKGNNQVCFSYQNVKELIFNNGILVTGIDHDKAMQRIRRNLELGLRNLSNSKDARCISRFLDTVFVGDYKPFKLSLFRQNYIKRMKNCYDKEMPAYTLL